MGTRSPGAFRMRDRRVRSGTQGACRSRGLEESVAAEHVPDRLGELACDHDFGGFAIDDPRAANCVV